MEVSQRCLYLQPGELVLYEGARFLHGRPLRLNGAAFANIFSHFKPVDWYGLGKSPPNTLVYWTRRVILLCALHNNNVHGDNNEEEESRMITLDEL
jgi:hypothetical protein